MYKRFAFLKRKRNINLS